MNSKSKLLGVMFLSMALVYSACKKSSTTPSSPALTPQTVAGQVAVNISQSLFGGLGAFDVSGGLSAPTSFAVHAKGKVLQSTINPECGTIVDTTLTTSETSGSTTVTFGGSVKASFTCINNLLSAYSTVDNVTISLANPDTTFSYKVSENFTVTSLDPTNMSANLSITGTLTSNATYQFKTGSLGNGTEVFDYTLTSIIVSPTTDSAVSGSATFNTSGTGPQGVWNYQGTIVFLGNNMATVTISGKTYTVNLLTGAVN